MVLITCSAYSDQIVERGNKTPGLQGLFNSSRANTPWIYLDIDRTKCVALGVPISELFNTLQVYLGSYYVNNFNEFGRSWQVNIQADQIFRGDARDIRQLQVRNNQGQMIKLATLMDVRNTSGPVMGMRYNMYSSTAITGNPAPGTSSGEAIALLEEIARAGTATLDGLRLDRAGLHAASGRQHGDGCFWTRRRLRVPGAGRPVRELEAAARGDPGRADVPALLAHRGEHRKHGRQPVHPDRVCRSCRSREQERDLDRRIRQAEPRRRAHRVARPRSKRAGCACGRS